LEWEQLIASVLSGAIVTERYPRTVLQVVVHILTADGSVLAAALHAAVSALLDAGIEMRYLPTAVTCCLTAAAAPPPPSDTPPISTIMEDERKNYPATTDNAAEILLDPSAEEEQERDTGTVVVVAHAEQKEVLALHTSNCCLSSNELLRCCAVAFRTGPAIVSFWRLALEQKTAREDRTLWSSDASA
jgi:ribonuclease PH